MKKLFYILITFGFLFSMEAQPPGRFYAAYGGTMDDFGYSCKQGLDGNYILLGSSSSGGNGQTDIYLYKIDSLGQRVLEKYLGGAGNDIGTSILLLNDSGYVIGGYTSSYGNGGYDMFLIRTDKFGEILWQKTFGGNDWDFGRDVVLNSDSNIVLVGESYSATFGKSDGYFVLCKLDGTTITEQFIGGVEDDEFVKCILLSDGNIAIAGNTKSYGDIHNDFWLVKIDSIGNLISSNTLGNINKAERCYDMIENANAELVFCGSYDTSYSNVGKNAAHILKSDLNGNIINHFIQSGAFTDDDKYNSITLSKDGKKYFLARKVYNGFFNIDVQPILMDTNYNINAATTYGGERDEGISRVIATRDKGYIMFGHSYSYGNLDSDMYLIKLDSAIYNAQTIVSFQPTEPNLHQKLFYSQGWIYYENRNHEMFLCRIIDLNGKIVFASTSEQSQIQLDQSILPGIYTLEIITRNKITLRFVKE